MPSIFGEEQDEADAQKIYLKKLFRTDPLATLKKAIKWEIFSEDLLRFRKS